MLSDTGLRLTGLSILCAANISLALLVIKHNRRSPVNRLFCLTVVVVVGWIAAISLSLVSETIGQALILGRIAFAFASAIPVTVLAMFEAFSTPQRTAMPRGLRVVGCLSIVLVCASLGPWIVQAVSVETGRPRFVYGPFHPIFAACFILTFAYALFTLAQKIHKASGVIRLQLSYLLLGVLLAAIGAITTNLLIPLLWQTSRYSLLGPYFSLIFISCSAHAIIRHRLMDIRLAIRKGVTYAISIAAAASVFTGLALMLTASLNYDHTTMPLTAALAIAVVVAIFFQPLKAWLQMSLDRYVYRETYDYQRIVRNASKTVSTLLALNELLIYLTDIVADTLKPESVAVYLREASDGSFRLRAAKLADSAREALCTILSGSSPLAAFCAAERQPLLRDDSGLRSDPLLQQAIEALHDAAGEIAVPFFQEQTISGLLIVGPKLSGDPYFQDDIDLLATLAGQAAIAITNAELYQEVVLIKEYIENILVTMESAVVAVAADGTITLFNAAAVRLTGVDPTRIKGYPLDRLPVSLATLLRATLADGEPRVQVETSLQHAEDHFTPVICSTSPLKEPLGSARGAVAVFNDLTQIKRLESEKRQAERLASVGALASGIAHEIKNPLVAIKTFAELLPERFTDEDFRHDFATVAIREIDRIDDLVARLRGLATPPARPTMLVDIREPIDETLALLRGQLEQAEIRIRQSWEAELPVIVGDHDQLKQLFLNVFMNSLESMQPGGELLIQLSTRLGLAGPTLLAEITDTGSGIPDDLLPKIFEPFVTTKSHGSGLGLSICRGIADAHRASIQARRNMRGPGTAILIEFPVASGSRSAMSAVRP